MADEEEMTLTIEGARLVYRNFTGNATQYKPEGTRTFAVVVDEATADQMVKDGWNVKCKPAHVDQEEGTDKFCFIEVTVGYKYKPPRIITISSSGRTQLSEDMVGMLDWAEFKNVDVIIRAYHWGVGDKTGVKAYLKSMYATIEEDELERKYGGVPQESE